LVKQQDVFFDALRIDDLTCAVEDALSRSQVVLVSGICMLRALKAAKLQSTLSIYVRRASPMRIRNDLDATDAEDGGIFSDHPDAPALEKEIHAYHADYQPLANSHIVLLWRGD
jgi:hypothetical protein